MRAIHAKKLLASTSILMRRILGKFLPEEIKGVLEYISYPQLRNSWGGAMNGQVLRQQLVLAMISATKPSLVVETGTFRGTTTAFFQRNFDGTVISIEKNPRYWGFSATRFLLARNVHIWRGDSRDCLRRLRSLFVDHTPSLFYLDAHWDADLPLSDELENIFQYFSRAVVLIDDFKVPFDKGYGFDDYGGHQSLTFEYIRKIVSNHDLAVYYPFASADAETGARRGAIVLAKDTAACDALLSVSQLRFVCDCE